MKGPREVAVICLCLLEVKLARRPENGGTPFKHFDGVCAGCGRGLTFCVEKEAASEPGRCGAKDGGAPCFHPRGHEGHHSNTLRTWPNKPAVKP